MKQSNENQSNQANKKGKTIITSNHVMKLATIILCGILTAKLNHNIARNLPIDLICKIVSYTYKFQHELKFQLVLRDIEDGTMCLLQTLTIFEIQHFINTFDDNSRRLDQWLDRMHPYNAYERYEGASRYAVRFDKITTSNQLQKQHKRCKYKTRKKLQSLQNVITLI